MPPIPPPINLSLTKGPSDAFFLVTLEVKKAIKSLTWIPIPTLSLVMLSYMKTYFPFLPLLLLLVALCLYLRPLRILHSHSLPHIFHQPSLILALLLLIPYLSLSLHSHLPFLFLSGVLLVLPLNLPG
ncbi:hypothetical protein Salat_1196400 [Sesamum alatum]|uniref:Uncharacterized protein n=1 Tax=Sesamum alatum TaxID=300844 RepID=A0AAE1YF15_9LAMI|nr:hypothetical protein Salat_1196400 [Sesamum alatum]